MTLGEWGGLTVEYSEEGRGGVGGGAMRSGEDFSESGEGRAQGRATLEYSGVGRCACTGEGRLYRKGGGEGRDDARTHTVGRGEAGACAGEGLL